MINSANAVLPFTGWMKYVKHFLTCLMNCLIKKETLGKMSGNLNDNIAVSTNVGETLTH